ncbi:hypothetical protein StoSoilB13_32920 (plasmid) [Arthrobacter sp. StoSoilB13]|nr:hypothetical protein StoSoilB13_32920 [Arthrobacter sp. StoSoilB13]
MQDIAQDAAADQVTDVSDARGPAEREADTGQRSTGFSSAGSVSHGAGVFQRVTEGLFAENVFAGSKQAFHHFAVQRVGDDHADDVDVVGFCDGLPGRVVAFVPETAGSEGTEFGVDVTDRDQAYRGQHGAVEGRCRAVCSSVRFARHACTDDGDAEAFSH